MERRPLQNNETEITENYIHRDEKEDGQEGRFLSREELEENQKVQEMLLKFLNAKSANKSELRKSLFNIAASLMKLLAILEDTPNQETTGCREKTRANHRCDRYDKSSTKDQSIPKKINRHLGQVKDIKDQQIPRVTIKRVCSNNKPGYVAHINRSLHENDECRINAKKSDSGSLQYIPPRQDNSIQTLSQKGDSCHNQLNNETEIVFECQYVKSTITSFAPQKLECLSQNQLPDLEISEVTHATIKDERLDVVKKEYLDDAIEKVNLNNDCETNEQNDIIPPLNSIHDSEESEKLDACSKKLEKNSNLKVHKDMVHDHITHSCEICGKKFMQKQKLEIHTKVVHNGRKLYQCDTCEKTFTRKDKLIWHMYSAHYGITHTCDSCGKTFTRKSNLKNHIDFVHKNLQHHKCGKCQKSFSCKVGLDRHMSAVHNGITYTCDLCDKIFTRKGNLKVHINTVHMSNGKPFKCDECLKTFNYKCNLTSHIEYAHKNITHPCDLCRKVFITKTGLRLHKDSLHNGINYPCDLCEKVFSIKSNLKVHKDSVHKRISHPCDLCKKVFTQKSKLKLHNNSVHNGKTHPMRSM